MLETLLLGILAMIAIAISCGHILKGMAESYPEARGSCDEA